jgi:hypothetical protein
MSQPERRKGVQQSARALRAELNEAQRDTLAELERYGWQLKFIRRPIFQPSIPVLFDGDRTSYAVLEADGTLNEHPPLDIRHE